MRRVRRITDNVRLRASRDQAAQQLSGYNLLDETSRALLPGYRLTGVMKAWVGDREFFYDLLVPGGVLVCDDYGFTTCPEATEAVDEFMAARPKPVLHCPPGQGIVVKR